MKKKKVLWVCALLLFLTGCSSDDDLTINEKNILGYWENEATTNGRGGLLFTSDGEIKYWGFPSTGTYTQLADNEQYSEGPWGYFWFDDDGTIHMQNRPKGSDPNPDELYYKIVRVTKTHLVIRTFGGFCGTPPEEGTDVVYKKINKPNK